MIFLTLGTHEQQFSRAVDLIAPVAAQQPVVAQHGATPPRPALEGVEWVEHAELDQIMDWMRDADGVVCHAGVGSIMVAVRCGKRPVVIPRLARFGEHVDDHQVQIARRFGRHGFAVPCLPGQEIEPLLEVAGKGLPQMGMGHGRLKEAVADAARGGRTRRRSHALSGS